MSKIRFNKESPAPSVWHVWLANIRFEGNNGGKKRPVLVTETNGQFCTILEISSKQSSYTPGIPVTDLDMAGLGRESVIRIQKARVVPKASLVSYLGVLSYGDRNTVKDALRGRGRQ